MSDSRLIRSENFPGVTVDHIRALMQRLIAHYPRGWESTNGELLIGFGEEEQTTATRGSWVVALHPGSSSGIKCWAGIEAYEQPGHTKVDFWDGYFPGAPPGVEYPPIGAAFEEFCEMIVREMQLLVCTREDAGKKHMPMDTKLDALLTGQTAIREDLSGLRQTVLARFDASEKTIIAAVIERLDQSQLAIVQAVLNATEAELVPISELEETLAAVQHMLSEIQQQRVALPDSTLASEVERLSEVVDAPKLDVKHKLKLAVPIIPFLLSYEGEVGLKSELNLEAAWKRLVGRVRDT